MKKIIPFCLSIILFSNSCKTNRATNETTHIKPNIIYIMADDLGYGDLGSYGQEIIQTPNIDQLAKEGIRFTQHYAGSTVCAPSRCVLMTGLHTGHSVVRGNGQVEPYGQTPIPDSTVTVAELLKEAGYTTGLIGKWGLGTEHNEGFPLKQGFDFFYGYVDQVLAHNYFPEYLWKNNEKIYLKNKVNYLDSNDWHGGLGSYSTEKVEYSHDLFANEALNFIQKNAENPFFLYLALTIPHNNGEALPGQKQEVPDYGIYNDKDWATDTIGYAAMISRMDGDVGKIMAKLSELGIDSNTLLIFTSDNGSMQEFNGHTAFFNSNGPLKGGKRDVYEGGIRIPFIAKWPGKIAKGTESDHISAFWDFLPTACEAAGIDAPTNIDGMSYLPTLLGEEQKEHDYLYWEFPTQGGKQAIRKGKWKAIRLGTLESADAPIELYDLSNDLGETKNIAAENPDIVEDMKKIFLEARTYDPKWKLFGNKQDATGQL